MRKITLSDLEFFSYHGCFSEEQIVGTWFNVDIEIYGKYAAAEQSDNLYDTVDYQKAYGLVKEEMQKPSKLIENVARRVCNILLKNFESIEKIQVKISKMNPPLGGKIGSVSYTLMEER